MPKPPIDPDSFDKVNFVIDAWTTGCDAPWYIYIETMKPAALKAFITLITFGWDDVLRGYFRPRGLHPRRTGKRKGKWARRAPRFPEIGEMIGSNVPGAYEVKGQRWSVLGKTLWRIDTVMQQAFFYWLVIDVVEDFAFDWTSLLFESYWCQDDALGRFSYSNNGWNIMHDNAWRKIYYMDEDYEYAPPWWGSDWGNTGSTWATVTAAISVLKGVGYDMPTSLRVTVRDLSNGKTLLDSGEATMVEDDEIGAFCTGVLPPNTEFGVYAWMEGAEYCSVGHGFVMGFAVAE